MPLKGKVWRLLEAADPGDRWSGRVDVAIMALITLNVVALVLESVASVHARAPAFFYWFEIFSVAVFTVEYLGRIWSCTSAERYRRPVAGRLRFALTPLLIIDLVAILPAYLPMIGVDLRALRGFRLLRIFRLLKFGRYSIAAQALGATLVRRREELLVTTSILVVLLVIASSLVYFLEHQAQPEAFPDIPTTMWWGVATLTTVGYGDIAPVTSMGRLVGGFIALLGVGMIALPTGILGAGFMDEFQARKSGPPTCPHCGEPLEP
jgi:voltage-gated potassium channel